ncbi:MAG: YfiR family protein [Verrucomicrobia bacterium]|nr:YfiR family protein [Verrucomicrobiota bacterium]
MVRQTGARLLLFAAVLLAGERASAAPAAPFSRYQVEAVFLFNFAQFVAWPALSFPGPDAPLVIGVIGQDPFGRLLDEVVRGERMNGRTLTIRRFAQVQDVDACHILFVARSEEARLGAILESLKNRPILTVSDIPEFAKRGGMIEFMQEKDRIRLRIALQRARSESLEISAKLLRPAEIVFRFPPGSEYAGNFPAPRGENYFVARLLAPALAELVRLSFETEVSLSPALR